MTRNTLTRWIAPVALALFAGSAAAHTADPGAGGFASGLAHPFLGLDHLLAMLAVGLWAAQQGGRARWAIPAAFVSATAAGGALAWFGATLPYAEPAIAVSVLTLGLIVAARRDWALPAAMSLAGGFAVFHGFAHGVEMSPSASPLLDATGFVLGTALLHAAGIAGSIFGRRAARYAGAAIAATGVAFILGL